MSRAPRSLRGTTFRRRLLLGGWLVALAVLVARSGELQVLEADGWRSAALAQHRESRAVPAARGAILDRDGVPLAVSHERYAVAVAPHELADTEQATRLLVVALGIGEADARRAVTSRRRWVPLPGRYPPSVREILGPVQGIHLEVDVRRFYPHDDLARSLLGAVREGRGSGGVEEAFDSVLEGTPGREILARDVRGRPIPGESVLLEAPRAGGEVVLTIDLELQEIAREALDRAVEETGAEGGDLLVTDPRTGDVLALVSRGSGAVGGLGAVNTPYEPGSTLKPFTVAALLEGGLARLTDTIDTGDGRWQVAGRTLTDVHPNGRVSLAEALRVSSNVGVAQAAQALTPAQQYQALRDFGFGAPTGIPLPAEAAGTLRRPDRWSAQSPASLSIGYEIAVTPLQMAMAYGALANGGRLMEPRLVREVRDHGRTVLERYEPRDVRQAVSPRVARALSDVLVDAVEEGTGSAARLGTFRVAGKSGTSRMYGRAGGYERGGYFSSFVGFFPAEDPQLVVFVKLERPQGAYYGGATAAPVTRATMEAVLAARRPPLDRRALAAGSRRGAGTSSSASVRFASSLLVPLTGLDERSTGPLRPGDVVRLPDVSGLPARVAVRRLHGLGLRVEWDGRGEAIRTSLPAGTPMLPGDTVRLLPERRGVSSDAGTRWGTDE